jgi:hypothetical protein
MGDEMIDLMAGDARLRRRLEAYAELRLTPDLATSSRIRARVLAVAHRHADLARADAALTIVPAATERAQVQARRRRPRWRRPLVGLLAASLAVGGAAGTVLAAKAGGALYEPRVWLETLSLPSDPSARALAELHRLEQRLEEAADALRSGDLAGAAAALSAYETILEQASAAAIAAHDDVAAAVLQAGVGHNLDVLRALILVVPDRAGSALEHVVQRAIERSDGAIQKIDRGQADPSGGAGGSGGQDAKSTRAPTPEPTPRPTKKPANEPPPGGAPTGGQPGTTSEPGRPDRSPKPEHGPS